MRYLSLFSGIEAATSAWHPLGWQCVGVAEIEKYPCDYLKHHYPNVPNLGSVTEITKQHIEALGHIDLVVGGFPCQDLSVAGKRKGLINEDGSSTRSGLFYTALRIVEWTGARFTLLENVPGMFSSNKGYDFAAMVGELLGCEFDLPRNGWQNAGVAASERGLVEWATLDAQYFGLAQRRKRVFIVRDTGNWRNRPPILLERESLQGNPAPSREKGQDVTEIAGTLAANGGGLNRPAGNANELDFCVVGSGEISKTLMAGSNKQDPEVESYAIAYNITFCDANGKRADRPNGGLYVSETDVTSTITKAGVGTNICSPAHTFKVRGGCEGGGKGYLGSDESAFTLSTHQDQHLFHRMAVRRLTPKECERLQGFPDNATKLNDKTPDGARYKALGNSMAVPCMAWIGKQIERATA